jgi:hypothetical protein
MLSGVSSARISATVLISNKETDPPLEGKSIKFEGLTYSLEGKSIKL